MGSLDKSPSYNYNTTKDAAMTYNKGWSTKREKLVRYWQEECRLYGWMYEQNVDFYGKVNRCLGISSVALSAITGTTLFNQGADANPANSMVLIGLGVVSLASTILSGLKELLDLNTLVTLNANAARENSSIVMEIDEQLNLDRCDRKDARDFMKSIKDRKNSLIQNGPIIPQRRWKAVRNKIRTKEGIGFLNRDVFNEYLEQSLDITKLQFSNSTNDDEVNTRLSTGQQYPTSLRQPQQQSQQPQQQPQQQQPQQHTITKKANLIDKLRFYSHLEPYRIEYTCNLDLTDETIQIQELQRIRNLCDARKEFVNAKYDFELLVCKYDTKKNTDKNKITNSRNKLKLTRDNYIKYINISENITRIDYDTTKVYNVVDAYRQGYLSDNEISNIIQIELQNIDEDATIEEGQLRSIINKPKPTSIDPSHPITVTDFTTPPTTAIPLHGDNIPVPREFSLRKQVPFSLTRPETPLPSHSEGCDYNRGSTVIKSTSFEETSMSTVDPITFSPRVYNTELLLHDTCNPRASISSISLSASQPPQQTATLPPQTTKLQQQLSVCIPVDEDMQMITSRDRMPSSASEDEFADNLMNDNLCRNQIKTHMKKDENISKSPSRTNSQQQNKQPGRYDALLKYQINRS